MIKLLYIRNTKIKRRFSVVGPRKPHASILSPSAVFPQKKRNNKSSHYVFNWHPQNTWPFSRDTARGPRGPTRATLTKLNNKWLKKQLPAFSPQQVWPFDRALLSVSQVQYCSGLDHQYHRFSLRSLHLPRRLISKNIIRRNVIHCKENREVSNKEVLISDRQCHFRKLQREQNLFHCNLLILAPVHTVLEKFQNSTITGYFKFALEEILRRDIK